MEGALAVTPLLLCFAVLLAVTPQPDWRARALAAALAWGALLAGLTELLSLAGRLERGWLLAAWLLALLGVGAAALGRRRARGWLARAALPLLGLSGAAPAGLLTPFPSGRDARGDRPHPLAPRRRSMVDGLLLLGPGLILGLALAVALLAQPNNWDSMTYHLARVAQWASRGSVGAYPTSIPRQLYNPPWAEYAVLHLYLLWGGDHLANLVQWASLLGCLAGASLLASQLGADRRGQMVTAALVATLPMGGPAMGPPWGSAPASAWRS
jgi:hypothetical protein